MTNSNTCFLCNGSPITKEHIIPRWLQKEFKLENQKLGLWNGTFLLYNQVTIPICKNCNGAILSRLEQKVRSSEASLLDFYLWALKIRFFLSKKDTMLSLDRSNPAKGKLVTDEEGLIGYDFVKYSLVNFERADFIFKPNPFGSVFLFDNPLKDGEFGLVDMPHPYWSTSLSLPNNKILAVLFTDRGMVKRDFEKKLKSTGGLKNYLNNINASSSQHLIRILMLRLLVAQYTIKNIPYKYSVTKNGIVSESIPAQPNYRKTLKKDVFIHLAQTSGLDYKFGIELYNSLPEHKKG